MPHSTKIATCCYCGTRAALVLTGSGRHELSCSGCGAPLHDLKMLRADHQGRHDLAGKPKKLQRPVHEMQKRRKPRKSLARRVLSEAVDFIEDIFD